MGWVSVLLAEGKPTERRELLGALAESIQVQDREIKLILRQPYNLLAEAA